MNKTNNDHFVYVYIDPRNFQEFYYGEGKGARHLSHLNDKSHSEKTKIIKEIRDSGEEPIIRVIAKGLTKAEAQLVEKTLLWRLGKSLTNMSTGHYSDKFRRKNTYHKKEFGFDYENYIYFMNVGEGDGDTRVWEDCREFGFMAAGQNWKKWGSKIQHLNEGDVICAYAAGFGYVGIGVITSEAIEASKFKIKGKSIKYYKLKQPAIYTNGSGTKDCDYIIGVEWLKSRDKKNALWGGKTLYSSQNIVSSLENQKKTLEKLELEFDISFEKLIQR